MIEKFGLLLFMKYVGFCSMIFTHLYIITILTIKHWKVIKNKKFNTNINSCQNDNNLHNGKILYHVVHLILFHSSNKFIF